MFQWVAQLQHRLRWRKVTQDAAALVQQGQGFIARTWPLTATMTDHDMTSITQEATAWLVKQIGSIATPHGWSSGTVIIGLAQMQGTQRTPLWKVSLPSFAKTDYAPALSEATTQLATLPRAVYPSATHLEVYLLDMGRIFRTIIPD